MNLIICASPFQVLLAEKIISLFSEEKFYSIMIMPERNKKYSYYANRLFSKSSGNGFYILNKPDKSKVEFFFELVKCKIKFNKIKSVNKVFLANVDNIFFQFILSSINFKELYSFDDGLANIVYSSGLYNGNQSSIFTKLIYYFLGNKYNYRKLKEMIKFHYTVYDKKNIVDKTILLDIFDSLNTLPQEKIFKDPNLYKNKVSILLGQPIYEQENLSKDDILSKQIDVIKKINKEFNIDYYFPHPREGYIVEDIEYIETDLIFEDYLIQNMKMDTFYTIYTFFSGAALHWNNLDNVKVISIQPSDYSIERLDNYKIMSEFGVNVYRML